ncbi:MAG: GtrA family protein [Candidatus Woesearchaeota archaeon]
MNIARIVRFGLVGGSGIIVNMGVLALLYTVFSLPLWLASALAIQSAIITNFIGHHHYTFRGTNGSMTKRFLTFESISITTALVSWATLNALAFVFGVHPWWIVYAYNFLSIALGFSLNYVFNTTYTWCDHHVS